MDVGLLLIFAAVYLTMLLGRAPGLALDRTGAALLGAIAIVVGGWLKPETAWAAIDTPTIGLLLGLMVVSAQFRLGGFYTHFTRHLAEMNVSPPTLLLAVIFASGLLSALLCNDIICLAMAPVLAEGCVHRKLDPVPFLLALACASNVGSAATLIGNPQNMLIGQILQLDFARYLWQALPPTVLALLAVWAVICWLSRGRWSVETEMAGARGHAFSAWQTTKGTVVLALLVVGFVVCDTPRELLALAAAGVLMLSKKCTPDRCSRSSIGSCSSCLPACSSSIVRWLLRGTSIAWSAWFARSASSRHSRPGCLH
jgi:Na+/H+ antiporter NhaD/arsenite permease-like protein